MTMKELDEEWFSTRLEENVTSIKWDDVDCEGYIASVKRVHLQLASGEERVVIVKILGHGYKSDTAPFAKQIGSAREADFFNHCVIFCLRYSLRRAIGKLEIKSFSWKIYPQLELLPVYTLTVGSF